MLVLCSLAKLSIVSHQLAGDEGHRHLPVRRKLDSEYTFEQFVEISIVVLSRDGYGRAFSEGHTMLCHGDGSRSTESRRWLADLQPRSTSYR